MKEITLEELLEAGCHFGHQVTRHNPKSRDFVFEARDNIHIIDLTKTKEGLDEAAAFVKSLAAEGGVLVVVGTKRQARSIVEEEVKRARLEISKQAPLASLGQAKSVDTIFMVTNRWIGGILTNFQEVAKNYKKLKEITARLQNPEEKAKYTKKEVGLWEKERQKLESLYGGIVDMPKIPSALFIIDTHMEDLAVREARATGVTTLGIVDTNADPTLISYPIPANDDAVGSVKLITEHIINAWIEGKQQQESRIKNQESGNKKDEEKKTSEKEGDTKTKSKPKVKTKREKKPEVEKTPSKSKKETKPKKP